MTVGLVLASGSSVRARLLADAGVSFEVVVPHVDEDAIKAADTHLPHDALALRLAGEKASTVSERLPDRMVVGADQLLVVGERRFDKPRTIGEAADHLRAFSGRKQRLVTGAVAMRAGRIVWSSVEQVVLAVRSLSEPFISGYLEAEGERVLSSVGGYRIEGLGAQLFERVEGDYFSVLGLPLLALLAFLREEGIMPS